MENGDATKTAASDLKAENKRLAVQFKAQHGLVVAFFLLIFIFHALAIYLFCSGFLLTRFVLPNRSECALPPIENAAGVVKGFAPGSPEQGCWYPKTFDKAIIIVIDALRYDFTVPFIPKPGDDQPHHFHNALPVLYETALQQPHNAFLRPFIADPPTTTLQRLKGLTTGTLPTFIDAGSNFAGTAIDEDNLVEQLYRLGRRVVHLGDDTWHALFPGLFEPNLTRPFDSFRVWDLHTLDDGVSAHLFPLLEAPGMRGAWDVVVAHYLGVDHAGHRYGPDHGAMRAKLAQMDGVLRRAMAALRDDTLLVVMGDHGMDAKGDHGVESDDEVQAALWMYSTRGVFGRSGGNEDAAPPATARERPVAQVDVVPTLALLLGLPVPFNNLGHPIEEAFAGRHHHQLAPGHRALAALNRLVAAQIRRYQAAYVAARNLREPAMEGVEALWLRANAAWGSAGPAGAAAELAALRAFEAYQAENLRVFKQMWAQFDVVSIAMGIVAMAGAFAVIVAYAQGLDADRAALTPPLLGWGVLGTAAGAAGGAAVGLLPGVTVMQCSAFCAAVGGIGALLFLGLWPARHIVRNPLPKTFWGGLCFLATLLLCVGFAANSFTIWEDEQLLFLLTTFGVLMLGSSLGQNDSDDRMLGASNAVSFLLATRLSSLSRLCRDEQASDCLSTYYSSSQSSTSAGWQLIIPYAVALLLPTAIRYFYIRTRNYHGSAVIWIGIASRLGLVMVAIFWTIDTADDGEWYPHVSKDLLKTSRVMLAQAVLALSFAAGSSTFIWASPMLAVKTEQADAQSMTTTSKALDEADPTSPVLTTVGAAPQARSKLIIYGYANTHGTRYFLLPAAWILSLLLVQKPMGQGTLALCAISILNVLEIIDANNLRRSPLGPVLLALLGSFYFFKTGHQAVLATIQWESAFIALRTIQYPLSAILVLLNTLGPQILCAMAVPAIAMWKVPPKHPGLLGRVAGSMATHLLFYAAIALATVVEATWLRRHLMLYRVFMPRMLLAILVLLVVELVSAVVAILGVRWSVVSVADVFGWPDA